MFATCTEDSVGLNYVSDICYMFISLVHVDTAPPLFSVLIKVLVTFMLLKQLIVLSNR